ncbi:MAG TPA: hypothetical protein VEU47_06060 [Candidatus Cybelea sp.]|nr:hypothetical protein [Candidatus Cybelea sp.]
MGIEPVFGDVWFVGQTGRPPYEPALSDVLADPIVLAFMSASRVSMEQLCAVIADARLRLGAPETARHGRPRSGNGA